MLPLERPDRIQIAFDDHRLVNNLGCCCPQPWPCAWGWVNWWTNTLTWGVRRVGLTRATSLRPWWPRPWLGATASTTPTRCVPDGLGRCWLCGQGALHSRYLPAQLPVGPCPPVGPGEPRVAGPGLGDWGWPRRRAVHHRPGLHHLRDLWAGQGGRPTPWLHRPAGLSPAAGRRRRHRGRAHGPTAGGPRQHRPGAAHFLRETLSCGRTLGRVRYAGAKGQITVRADSGFYTHGVVSLCRKTKVRFSITNRQHQSLRNLIEAIPEDDWTPIPLYLDFGDGTGRGRPSSPASAF